jgi:AcrR family transcriptional regulator
VTRQEGDLARTHVGMRGLPRGRSRLPAETVRAAQRDRLLRAVIAAAASNGFAGVTVADVVRLARVSRAAFYAHFDSKEECFLAATREGGELLAARISGATRQLPAGTTAEDVLRAGLRAYLQFLADEPEFARVFYVGMPSAGPRAVQRLEAAQHRFARFDRAWHERARRDHPDWPAVPYEAYYALAGGTAELVRSEVSRGGTSGLTALEDILVALHLAVLAARPWQGTRAASDRAQYPPAR